MKIFGYWLSLEGRQMKTFRGNKVPFTLRVRWHYPTGSKVILHLFSNTFEWAKK